MIKSLDETIKKLILEKGQFAPGDVDIRFDQPTRDWSAGLTKPAINCYLYDLRENTELRSREWIVEREPNGQARKKIAPLRVDLSYLITAWTNEVEDEHAVLWRVLVALSSVPVLPASLLKGDLVHQPYPIATQTAQGSEAMHNLSDLWNRLQLCATKDELNEEYVLPHEWCDAIMHTYRNAGLSDEDANIKPFKCPSGGDARHSSYAMNSRCQPDSPRDTVLLFETKAGWNQHGGRELFTFDNHDPKGGLVLLNDGTVKFIRTEEELKQLRWKGFAGSST